MEYKKIKTKKIYEEVAEALINMIKNGSIKPGDRLDSVQQLAENFQVGRSAIREALSALRAMGLVEMRQGEGTYVKAFDPKSLSLPVHTALLMNKEDIHNLLEVRKILEAGSVDAAAEKRTEEHLLQIKEALDEMKDADDEKLREQADLHFHLAIAKASQNSLLLNLMDNVSEMMGTMIKETRRILLYSEQARDVNLYEDHLNIYKAILSQDQKMARQSMMNHLEKVERVLMTAYE